MKIHISYCVISTTLEGMLTIRQSIVIQNFVPKKKEKSKQK